VPPKIGSNEQVKETLFYSFCHFFDHCSLGHVGFLKEVHPSLEEKGRVRTKINQMRVALLFVVLSVFISCGSDEQPNQCKNVRLSADIMPIINANCAINTCHANAISPLLNSTESVIANAVQIKERTGDGSMPPGGHAPLTAQEIDLIACWVDGGALDN